MIVGITGSIGSGKTTFAKLLAAHASTSRHWETWQIVSEVATKLRAQDSHPAPHDIATINEWLRILPDVVASTTHAQATFDDLKLTDQRLKATPEYYSKLFEYLAYMQQHPELQAKAITEDNKEQFRSLLQWLGGYLVSTINEGIWYDEIVRRIHEQPDVDITTVGGVRYPADARRLVNAGGVIIQMDRQSLSDQDVTDLTERERHLIKPDAVIHNSGDLNDLQVVAGQVFNDLYSGDLKQSYSASVA